MYQRALTKNTLFYGDNLDILRQYVAAESIDLIYLDPPFNSNRNYNVLYKEESGSESTSQIKAFEDTWHWNRETEEQYRALVARGAKLGTLLEALVSVNGRNQMTAYLVMMAIRLVELHRVLKSTGSLYLHCDSTASHYLKMVLDCIFGAKQFRNELVWRRSLGHSLAKGYDNLTDVIFYYTKSFSEFTFNQLHISLSEKELQEKFPYTERETGRRFNHQKLEKSSNASSKSETRTIQGQTIPTELGWIWTQQTFDERLAQNPYLIYWTETGRPRYKLYADEYQGLRPSNLWLEIMPLSSTTKERLGYPTQKPLTLLERILQASSNPGDVILDPFCGCGTAVHAAQKLGRIWVGIEKLPLAIELIRKRLSVIFKMEAKEDYALLEVEDNRQDPYSPGLPK